MTSVMIVENTSKPLRSAKKLLSSINFDIPFVTGNGFEAIEKYEIIKPDLLILDLNLSKSDGLSVLKEIKKKHLESRIIVLSTLEDAKLFDECMKSGAISCIKIPYNMKEFVDFVTNLGKTPVTNSTVAPILKDEQIC